MSQLTTVLKAKARLAALKAAITLLPVPRPMVLLGANSALQLCATISHLGAKRVFIVTDAVLQRLGVIAPLEAQLQQHGITSVVFAEVTPDPTFSIVDKGLLMLQASGCDAVLAIGGGSSIDAAKVIALAASNRKTPQQLVGILKGRQPSLPLFVVPTTAGTGSEVTAGAVISDDQTHQKGLVIDPRVVPLATALDPVIMQGMPKSVTADTGIDALTHALEAWMSEFANTESDHYASSATRMILNNLPTAWHTGSDLPAREALALASHYAGIAINRGGLGYVHAIAHQLGAHYGVPHGRANATVLPYILDFNREASEQRLAKLARVVGVATATDNDAQATDLLIKQVKALIKTVNINTQIPQMNTNDFAAIVQSAFAEAHGTYAVPKYMTEQDAHGILLALQRG